jgi:predicted small lipoprotein YifL
VKRTGQWLWALAVLALLTGCGGCGPALPPVTPTGTNAPVSPATGKGAGGASDSKGGFTKGFKAQDYDEERRLKSTIIAKEALDLTSDVVPLKGLRVETYDKEGNRRST